MLSLVIAPDPIFKKKATAVEAVTDEVRALVAEMFEVLYREQGVGLGANMVGLLQRLVVIDLQEGGRRSPLALINPEIIARSDRLQTFEEGSLSFPGIRAEVTRPAQVSVRYLNEEGEDRVLEAEGWLATVLQHEIDYLEGVVFLDHLSAVKRSMLMKKYKKLRRTS